MTDAAQDAEQRVVPEGTDRLALSSPRLEF